MCVCVCVCVCDCGKSTDFQTKKSVNFLYKKSARDAVISVSVF